MILKLLPSSLSKRDIWKKYCEALQAAMSNTTEIHQVQYVTFCRLWKQLAPQVVAMKPMTDLCWTCQRNSTSVLKASNQSEERKKEALKDAIAHI